jgi:hypothetical protein
LKRAIIQRAVAADRLYGFEPFNLQNYERAAPPGQSGRKVHRSARGAADSLTITSSNTVSMKAIGRGVAVQVGTNCMAFNSFRYCETPV